MHSNDIATLMKLPEAMVLRWLCKLLSIPYNPRGVTLRSDDLISLELHLESSTEEQIKYDVYNVFKSAT